MISRFPYFRSELAIGKLAHIFSQGSGTVGLAVANTGTVSHGILDRDTGITTACSY